MRIHAGTNMAHSHLPIGGSERFEDFVRGAQTALAVLVVFVVVAGWPPQRRMLRNQGNSCHPIPSAKSQQRRLGPPSDAKRRPFGPNWRMGHSAGLIAWALLGAVKYPAGDVLELGAMLRAHPVEEVLKLLPSLGRDGIT